MKIGIDARLWGQTGVGRYIRNLILNLQEIDKNNDYVLLVRSEDYDDVKFQISNFKFQISKCDIPWHSIEEQLKMPQILYKKNLDLVHFPYYSVPVFYNKPFVVTIHDLILNHFSTGEASTLPLPIYRLKHLAYKFIISQAAKKSKKIIVPSISTKKEIQDHFDILEDKIVITYEGVDSKILNVKEDVGIKGKYFLYVGNFYPHKNLDRLILSFGKLKENENSDNVKLFIVGKKDYFYQKLLKKIKKLNLEKSIIFVGLVDDENLKSLYVNAIALVFPSLMEGFGLPALEAMANKCLVLASDIPVFRELLKDSAIFFDPLSVEDIYQKMNSVLKNKKENLDIIEKGFLRSQDFSWEKTASQTLKVYEDSSSAGSE